MNEDSKITYFAETDHRNRNVRFGIKAKDRARHTYIIGKTGTGKSTLLETLAIQDVHNGEGLAIIDPHGSFAERILEYIPEHRINDVVYFAPFDLENPIAFNVMENIGADKRHLVASGLMSTFKKIWADSFSARMEYMLNNTILALLEYPGATLMQINRMFSDKEFRKKVVDCVTDPAVKSFWVDEFAKYTDRFAQEATPAIQNKIGQFTTNPVIRNIIGQPVSSFDFRDLMDKKKIFIANLSKGRIGETSMSLLGGTIITKIYLSAMERAEMSRAELEKAPPFYFYVDEFQNFANEAFAQILSESRKYKLALTVANQYVNQMTEEVRDAILGNVGTMISFRIGPDDADIFEKQFSPVFTNEDLVNLGFAQIYLRLMIDGQESRPFSARTILPVNDPQPYKERVIEESRAVYAKPRSDVEGNIRDSLTTTQPEQKEEKNEKNEKKEILYPKKDFEKSQTSIPQNKKFTTPPQKPTEKIGEKSKPKNNAMKDALLNIVNIPKETSQEVSVQKKSNYEDARDSTKVDTINNKRIEDEEVENFPSKDNNKKHFKEHHKDHTTHHIKDPIVHPAKTPFSQKMQHILRELEEVDDLENAINTKSAPKENPTISLNNLAKDKSANTQKMSSLKEALQNISQKPNPQVPAKKEEIKKQENKPEEKSQNQIQKEVPEEVLEKLLNE